MMAEKDFLGHGALNLDMIYEIDGLEVLKRHRFDLDSGHEITGSHEDAIELLKLLDVKGRFVAKSGGGSSANTISVLSHLGFKTGFLGGVGDDDAGVFILGSMAGVDTSMVIRTGRSAICLVILDTASRDRAMMVVPHDGEFLKPPDDVLSGYLRGTNCLHLSSVVTKEGLEGQIELVKMLFPSQVLSFDPGEIYASRGLDESIIEIIKRTDILFVTEAEAALFTGKTGGEAVYRLLSLLNPDPMPKRHPFFIETGGPVIVLKQGAMGASLYSRQITLSVPAEPLTFDIVDNTGAGDAFNAGVLAGIFRDKDPMACLKIGSMLAARSLSAFGRAWMDRLYDLAI